MGSQVTLDAPARSWRLLGFLLAGLALLWLAAAYVALSSEVPSHGEPISRADRAWAYDYEAYIAAAQRVSEAGSPYQALTLSGPYRPGPHGLYMYSPILAVGLTPLSATSVDEGATWWFVMHVLALAAACALMPVQPEIRLFGFAAVAFSFAVMRDMALGNVSALLLLPMVMTWRWLDRPLGQIAQAVAISVRPTLGILLIWQLLRRQWRAVAWTLAAGLALILLTLPFVGVGGYLDYITVLRNMTDVSGVTFNHDLGSVALGVGAGSQAATLALLAGYAGGIGAMLLSLRRDRETGFMVTLMASLLLAPLLWDHYLAMLLLPAAFLAGRGHPWALLLPLASWLPVAGSWTWLCPLIVIAVTLLLFLARDPEPVAPVAPEAPAVAAGTT
jgi:hypothetical protein